ncbi:MAG: ABC transporter permease [Solobacterium sp.]|jgi:simple sugar transport system permease protein|nr:ABC transporter permease [Solobacterium sp.]
MTEKEKKTVVETSGTAQKDPRRTDAMRKTQRIEAIMEIVRIVAGMAIAYIVALLILVAISDDPVFIVKQFILGPFSSPRRIGSIVNLAVPFTLCGLSMCFMYAVNKFNLIGESIFMLSGCIITWVALAIGQNMPAIILIPLLLIVGAIVGAVLSFIPAIMDRKLNANVVVVSLMLNSVIAQLAIYILRYYMKDPGISFIGSYELPKQIQFATLFGKMRIGAGVIIALIAVVIVSIIFFKTAFGWKMRIVGSNPKFATAVGLSTLGISFAAQLAGGALAGVAGATEIMNSYKRFQWTASTGHGFDGLLVAVLAKKNPVLVPIGALFLAYVRIGADVVNTSGDIPYEFISVIQGIIILLVAAESFLSGFKNRLIYRSVQADKAKKSA